MAVDHVNRASNLIGLNKFDQAIRKSRLALAENPENAEAHYYHTGFILAGAIQHLTLSSRRARIKLLDIKS